VLTNLAEDVIFALIRYIGSEVLSYDTVPVWSVVLVKEGLDVLSNWLLLVCLIHDFIYLCNEVFLLLVADLLDHPTNVSFSGSHYLKYYS